MTVANDPVLSEIRSRGFELMERLLGPPARVEGPNATWHVPWREDRKPSLVVLRTPKGGHRAGFWRDFSRDESGDPLDAISRVRGIDPATQFPALVDEACRLLGIVRTAPAGRAAASEPIQSALDTLAACYGLQWSDFTDAGCEVIRSPKGNSVSYPIRLADGSTVRKFKSVDRDDAGKRRSWGEKGSGFSSGLMDLGLASCAGATLILAGGEEKAIAARICGRCAVAPASGEKRLADAQLEMIRTAAPSRIVIAYDADEAGRKGAADAAAQLAAFVPDVRIVTWTPGVPAGYDLTDHLVIHGTAGVSEILEAADHFPGPTKMVPSGSAPVADEWPELIPLEGTRPSPFTADMLPTGFFRLFCQQAISAFQQPPEFVVLGALGIVGAAMAGTWEVEPKPDWHEPVQIWSLLVGASGTGKSPLFRRLIAPLKAWETEHRDNPEFGRRADEKARLDELKAKAAKRYVKAADEGADDAQLNDLQRRIDEIDSRITAIGRTRPPGLLIDDATPEALVEFLDANDGRAAIASDEANSFGDIAGRYAEAANTSVYLKGHDGGFLKVNRKGSRVTVVPSPALAFVVCAQPGVVERFLCNQEFIDCGLVFRFLAVNPERRTGVTEFMTTPFPVPVAQEWDRRVRALLDTPRPQGKHGWISHRITLDPDARELFESYWFETRDRHEIGDLSGVLQPFGSKLAGQTLRIAAVLHAFAIDTQPHLTPISRETLGYAIGIARCISEHVRSLFGIAGVGTEVSRARCILDWARREKLDTFTKRDAHRALRGTFKVAADLDRPLAMLVETGHVRPSFCPKTSGQNGTERGGRPSQVFEVRP